MMMMTIVMIVIPAGHDAPSLLRPERWHFKCQHTTQQRGGAQRP